MRTLSPHWTANQMNGHGNVHSELWKDWERFFDDLSSSYSEENAHKEERNFAPAAEVVEHDEQYSLSLDLPGLKKEDIKIEMSHNVLTISGERKREERTANKKVQRVDKSYGSFQRSFTLPSSVQVDKIEARYEDGVLYLALPKAQIAQPRKIEIQSGKPA